MKRSDYYLHRARYTALISIAILAACVAGCVWAAGLCLTNAWIGLPCMALSLAALVPFTVTVNEAQRLSRKADREAAWEHQQRRRI